MPPGENVGDILKWDGYYWESVNLADLVAGLLYPPVAYHVIANGEIAAAVPSGHKLGHITIVNNEAFTITVSLGLTEHGTELLDNEPLEAHKWIDISVERLLSTTSASSLWMQIVETLTSSGIKMIVETKLYYAS